MKIIKPYERTKLYMNGIWHQTSAKRFRKPREINGSRKFSLKEKEVTK